MHSRRSIKLAWGSIHCDYTELLKKSCLTIQNVRKYICKEIKNYVIENEWVYIYIFLYKRLLWLQTIFHNCFKIYDMIVLSFRIEFRGVRVRMWNEGNYFIGFLSALLSTKVICQAQVGIRVHLVLCSFRSVIIRSRGLQGLELYFFPKARAGLGHYFCFLHSGQTSFFRAEPGLDFILPWGLHGPKLSVPVPTQTVWKSLSTICAKICIYF